jgi:hypothetical protein
MIDKSKIIILILGSNNYPWSKNWRECYTTWVPLVKQLGYHVKVVLDDPNIENYFSDEGDILKFKIKDSSKKSIFDKRLKYPIQWILDHTNYEYYFAIDSDVFIHPHRFDQMMVDNISQYNPKYMGCCMPYRGIDPNALIIEFLDLKTLSQNIHPLFYFASGASYMLSRDILGKVYSQVRIENEDELEIDDYVLGRAMIELGIPLLQDTRIHIESKYNELIENPHSLPNPHIGDKDSHLAVQHYLNGYMAKTLNELLY